MLISISFYVTLPEGEIKKERGEGVKETKRKAQKKKQKEKNVNKSIIKE